MHDERFDELTRAYAERLPRRAAIRLIAGAVPGVMGLLAAGARAVAKGKKGKRKRKNKRKNRPSLPAACVVGQPLTCPACQTCVGGLCESACATGETCCNGACESACANGCDRDPATACSCTKPPRGKAFCAESWTCGPQDNPCAVCGAPDVITCCECVTWDDASGEPPDDYDWCRSDFTNAADCHAACDGPAESESGFFTAVWRPGEKPVCGPNNQCRWEPCD
jgi:hypothetical protein